VRAERGSPPMRSVVGVGVCLLVWVSGQVVGGGGGGGRGSGSASRQTFYVCLIPFVILNLPYAVFQRRGEKKKKEGKKGRRKCHWQLYAIRPSVDRNLFRRKKKRGEKKEEGGKKEKPIRVRQLKLPFFA